MKKEIKEKRRYPDDFINKIICGDCLEVMKDIPNKSVDLVLTDPPYFETKHFMPINLKKIVKELFRVCKDNCFLVSDFFRPAIKIYLETYEPPFKYYDMVALDVTNSMANCAFGLDHLTPSLVFKKGNPKVKSRYINLIKVIRTTKFDFWHPSPKYLKGYETFIKMFSNENDLILDPFLGSGTTAVACKMLKRNFIGIELNPEYCKIAEERLRQEILL